MATPEISIVIPFKDEEARLPKTLAAVLKYAKRFYPLFEIILVDDGSTDNSINNVKSLSEESCVRFVSHKLNKGKGAAVRSGVLAARGKLILFSDADLSTPIKELGHMMSILKENDCDIVIGSRALPGSRITTPQPLSRVFVGKVGNLFIRLMTGMPFKDTQCGFKLFTRQAARELFAEQHFPGWSFDIEVLLKATQKKYHICEVPVEWHDVIGSKVSPVRDAIRVLLDVVRINRTYKV